MNDSSFIDSLVADTSHYLASTPELSLWEPLSKIVLVFILLIALIYGLVFFLRKYVYQRGNLSHGHSMKIIDTVYLNPKSRIHLIQVGKKFLIVGENEQSICKLMDYTGDDPT